MDTVGQDTLLQTKLFAPPVRPDVVRRERLLANAAIAPAVTLLCAPAGFGKTTMARMLAADNGGSIVWLSLDEADGNPTRFVRYLVAAIGRSAPEVAAQPQRMLAATPPVAPDAVLAELINALSLSATSLTLVLDDYHRLDSQACDSLLGFLIEHQPPALKLVITTREDPDLPLSRLRARGQLRELRASQLRFDETETDALLNDTLRLGIDTRHLGELHQRTEGWITGLQLAALSLQGSRDASAFIDAFSGSHRFVLDYLLDEVLHTLTPELQSFLRQTARLERFCAPLCDAVTGRHDSLAVLDEIERANLFIIPLDDERRWYRYHHLFAEVVLAHAPPDKPAHARAARWFAEQALWPEAIKHAFAADEASFAADMLELAWPVMESRFEAPGWLDLLQHLDDTEFRRRPVLQVARAWASLEQGDLKGATALLNSATAGHAGETPDVHYHDAEQWQQIPASVATARCYISQSIGDSEGAIEAAAAVLAELPESEALRRSQILTLMGAAYWFNGELPQALETFRDGIDKLKQAMRDNEAVCGYFVTAELLRDNGRLNEAIDFSTEALRQLEEKGMGSVSGAADLHRMLAEFYLQAHKPERARQCIDIAHSATGGLDLPDWRQRILNTEGRWQLATGDYAGALASFAAAEKLATQTPLPDIQPVDAWRVRALLASGQIEEAQRTVATLTNKPEPAYTESWCALTHWLVAVRLAEAGLAAAPPPAELARLAAYFETRGWPVMTLEARVLLARLTALTTPASAVDALQSALAWLADESFDQFFLSDPDWLAPLLPQCPGGRRRDRLQRALGAASPVRAALNGTQGEELSEREHDVLRLLNSDLTGPQIAEQLFISLNTFRTHSKNIYSKLDVNNRQGAIRRAQELGLLT